MLEVIFAVSVDPTATITSAQDGIKSEHSNPSPAITVTAKENLRNLTDLMNHTEDQ